MKTHADKTQEKRSQSVANDHSQKQRGGGSAFRHSDNRPEAVAQRNFQEIANNSPQVKQLIAFHTIANSHGTRQQKPIREKKNNTGLHENLKAGIETLSGYSMDDVNVHYNSHKSAQLQAHAYAQGTDIHLAPGQEAHLPHEAWHVVQQKQGRVRPTTEVNGVVINDDSSLEREADLMGGKATTQEKAITNEVKPGPVSVLNSDLWNIIPVAQRVIIVKHEDGDNSYNAENKDAFMEEYDESLREEMLSAMLDFDSPPGNIDAALADPRRFFLEREESKFGVFYKATTEALVKKAEGGRVREAGESPEFVSKPLAGFEQIVINGLINCIGIVIESRRDDQVTAAVGAHFLTPEAIVKGQLSERGTKQLNEMIQCVKPYGNLTAILCTSAGAKEQTGSSKDAMTAIRAIDAFLKTQGVLEVVAKDTRSKITYQLGADGIGSFME